VRIAIVYDCLYPHTVGGAERWYRSLAERLALRHQVTYITRRQWNRRGVPDAPAGVRVVAVSGGAQLYTASGRRSIIPPLRFGGGVLGHLLRHRRDYDVVHTCAFPYFPLIAAQLAAAVGGPPVVADWLETWSDQYWRSYLGGLRGRVGAGVQRLCMRLTTQACVLSDLQAARLVESGYRGEPLILRGIYAGHTEPVKSEPHREPLVVYVGRHIPEKRVSAIPAAIAAARVRIPGLRAVIFSDGPERSRVVSEIQRLGLQEVVRCPGFMPWEDIDNALRRALCLLLPSEREGYGLVVVEAAARGTPSIVVRAPDNAATELIAHGENGWIADGAEPPALAAAIEAVHAAGPALVQRTRAWFAENAPRLLLDTTINQLEALYGRIARVPSGAKR
jgi:glycosyltransferase involved in cell wall biosynthesis